MGLRLWLAALLAIHASARVAGAPKPEWTLFEGSWLDTKQIVRGLLGRRCFYRHNPATVLKELLKDKVAGQPLAVASVLRSIEAWQLKSNHEHPWVMVLTGPPGTGKTMTADLIGQAMMKSLERVEGGNFEWRMEGVLDINGHDYATPGPESSRRLKLAIVKHLRHCSGRGVIILDEFHYINAQALEELRPLFTGQSRISVMGEDGVELVASAKSAVVVLTTDVLKSTTADFTANAMAEAHIEASGSEFTVEVDGEVIPRVVGVKEAAQTVLRSTMANALREHLRKTQPRLGLSEIAQSVVTFLPFSETGVEDVIRLAFDRLRKEVESNPMVLSCGALEVNKAMVDILACDEHIGYDTHVMATSGGDKVAVMTSTHGARLIFDANDLPFAIIKAGIRRVALSAIGSSSSTVLERNLRVTVDPVAGSVSKAEIKAFVVPQHGGENRAAPVQLASEIVEF